MKKEKLRDKKFTAIIRVQNLTIAQSIALEDMMSVWQDLGSMGCSRWTSFFADGDGNFRPEVLYNGHSPNKTDLLKKEETWRGNEYRIDFDSIGWKLHDNEEIRVSEAKKFNFFRIAIGTISFLTKKCIKDFKRKIKLKKIKRQSDNCKKLHPEDTYAEDRPSDSN